MTAATISSSGTEVAKPLTGLEVPGEFGEPASTTPGFHAATDDVKDLAGAGAGRGDGEWAAVAHPDRAGR